MDRLFLRRFSLALLAIVLFALRAPGHSEDLTRNAIHNLRQSLNSILKIKNSMPVEDLQVHPEVIRMAFLILGLTENISAANNDLPPALKDVEDQLGPIILPYYLQFSDERDEMLRTIMSERTDERTVISASELNLLHKGRTVGQLISGAEIRIVKKTSMQFAPRPGRLFSQ